MALGQEILVASEAAFGLLQKVLAELDYRLDVCLVTEGGHIQHLRSMQKQTWKFSLPICRSRVTILFAIQVYRFYEMCHGIMNNPVQAISCKNLTLDIVRCRRRIDT
jgi:hypothetical protein